MDRVLEPQTIDKYLDKIQKLKVLSTNDPEKLEKLLDFVLEQKLSFGDSQETNFLFKGEHAFHNGNYEQALINYMQARAIPSFEFFCYRATAYVSFLRKDLDKAISFIHKALGFRPQDYDTLKLYHEILIQKGDLEKAGEIKKRIENIESDSIESEFNVRPLAHPNSEKSAKSADNEGARQKAQSWARAASSEHSMVEEEEPLMKQRFTTQAAPFREEERGASFETYPQETTSHFIAAKLGVDLDAEKALEGKILEFQAEQTARVQNYLDESKRSRKLRDRSLYILNGWSSPSAVKLEGQDKKMAASEILLAEQTRQTSGGFFIQWNGMGIAINPGPNFLEHFHKEGLYISDIHFVIVTKDSNDANSDVQKIYDLNYQLNKISPELHVINYYLNHKAYQELSHKLKPNFKQERNTVHSLELFLDSPDVEKETLAEGILLSYFSTTSRAGFSTSGDLQDSSRAQEGSCMGIRLDLTPQTTDPSQRAIRLGYVSGSPWSPLLAHHLGYCDLLITGFGTTNPSDYGKLNYNESSLGYFGTYTLLDEVKPRLLLCTEFDGREGDIRLEVTKKLRAEFEKAAGRKEHPTTILPGDKGLRIDLGRQKVECSISKTLLDPEAVVVVKSSETFGVLQYLSPACIL